jgi:hypothetical protein
MDKRQYWIAAGVFLLILVAVFAFSQQWVQQATVKATHEFVVGSTVLPAGTYSVKTATESNNLIMLVNNETGASASAMNIDIYNKPNTYNENSRLVFVVDKSGRQVLHQIWIFGDNHGHDLVHQKDIPEPR